MGPDDVKCTCMFPNLTWDPTDTTLSLDANFNFSLSTMSNAFVKSNNTGSMMREVFARSHTAGHGTPHMKGKWWRGWNNVYGLGMPEAYQNM